MVSHIVHISDSLTDMYNLLSANTTETVSTSIVATNETNVTHILPVVTETNPTLVSKFDEYI